MKVEQDGELSSRLDEGQGFVRVQVPIRMEAEGEGATIIYRYQIGSFLGRETTCTGRGRSHATLTFRIPKEHFRDRERLVAEVLLLDVAGNRETLWQAVTRLDG